VGGCGPKVIQGRELRSTSPFDRHNAGGIGRPAAFEELSDEEWFEVLDLNHQESLQGLRAGGHPGQRSVAHLRDDAPGGGDARGGGQRKEHFP
jgi:hypothetical protein